MRKILLIIPFLFLAFMVSAQNSAYSTPASSKKVTKNTIKIYPNPAINFIGLNEVAGVASIVVYNLVGRKMKNFNALKGEKYNISDLPKGMYLVQLKGTNGKVLTTQRMSKK